ncbi:hypothetical protein F2Q69_00041151 [Brassica cretica]|uniref:1-phosphatidylinositol-4-phosphate 5-kinase n=1 Tax=Brassica cretica TaxID=69181 RepID=A0A8S9NFK4_BRACR|nr:hypothetical protein F2Q69_00041151 [Brassica cretica]
MVLLRMLPRYYEHVGEHENTLITKFFGVHRLKLKWGKKVRFVVMGNMFCTELKIHRRYDLKGSTQGRFTEKNKIREKTTMKDLDLAYEFHMDKLLREALFNYNVIAERDASQEVEVELAFGGKKSDVNGCDREEDEKI